MDSSFLTFSPKVLSRKKHSFNVMKRSARSKLLKLNVNPLVDGCRSPSNLHNIEKNQRDSVGSKTNNYDTIVLDDSIVLLSESPERARKAISSHTCTVRSCNERKPSENYCKLSSKCVKDNQIASSSSNDKYEEIRIWLNELHNAHEKKRQSSSWSFSSSVIECSTLNSCSPKLDRKSVLNLIVPESSIDESIETEKQTVPSNPECNDHASDPGLNDFSNWRVPESSSDESFKPTRQKKFHSPALNDSSANTTANKTPSCSVILERLSSSDERFNHARKKKSNSSASKDSVHKSEERSPTYSLGSESAKSSNNERVKPVRRKKIPLIFSDGESDDSNDNFRMSVVKRNTIDPTYSDKSSAASFTQSLPSSKGSDNSCSRLSIHRDDSVISVSTTDRIISNIYGKTWDKESVLTPAAKNKTGKKKPDPKEGSTSIDDILSEFYGDTWDKENVLTPRINHRKPAIGKENTPPVTRLKGNIIKSLERKTPKTKLPINGIGTQKYTSSTRSVAKNVKSQETLSFLRSLSVCSPSRCDPKALIFKKEFKKKKEDLCQELFKLYNAEVFENKLPPTLAIEWNVRMKRTAGFCHNSLKHIPGQNRVRSSRIQLSTKVCTSADRVRDTLIHELCHAATWIVSGIKKGHGAEWKAWTNLAVRRFPDLPPIGRCHAYKIETKYTYECKRCGYSFGRHSKSLDLQRKRCGYCFGEFELLVNIKSKNTNVESKVTRTPRTASGFALYVKENYKTTKEKNSGLKHAEIMKLLGNQFSGMKVGSGQ